MNRYAIAIPLVVLLLFVICLLSDLSSPVPAHAQGQPSRCAAAVARLQQTLTAEAHTYADARRAVCQVLSLSPEMREGKPQAINDGMQRSLTLAKQESAAAYSAAAGCDTSKVKRPEVMESWSRSVDAYNSCVGPPDESCRVLSGPIYDVCVKADQDRRAARARGPCAALITHPDCNSIKVADSDQPQSEGESVVDVPGDLKPECRDAYVRFATAEREYAKARKRVQDLAPNFGAAGARGTAMYSAAREDMNRAAEKQRQAKQNLDKCTGVSEAKRPCEVNFDGRYTHPDGPLEISGGTASQTWASGGRKGKNNWSNCRVNGNSMTCKWTGTYEGDPDKTADRKGTVTAILNGASLDVTYNEDEPTFHWNVAPYPSAIHKGAVWRSTLTRVGGARPCEPTK